MTPDRAIELLGGLATDEQDAQRAAALQLAISALIRTKDLQRPEDRFWAKVNKTETCWLWTATRMRNGYGRFYPNKVEVPAHRYAYELLVGPIPSGHDLDHLKDVCPNRHCVRPAHLEPVTHRENLLRGDGWAGQNARKTHCKHGHAFTPENTYRPPKGGRACKACAQSRKRRALCPT